MALITEPIKSKLDIFKFLIPNTITDYQGLIVRTHS